MKARFPGAVHAPRGMLEFWVDPESPYARDVFPEPGKRFMFFCAGGLRSALAARAMQEMGLTPVCHMEGGYSAWGKKRAIRWGPKEKKKAPGVVSKTGVFFPPFDQIEPGGFINVAAAQDGCHAFGPGELAF
ncbi:MAG: hypothetical protein CM1200mP20_05140 [Pseudomonadota bacterium]|nr:MAG: hypothetical protein CM1200mP20_05140 [Pseudomonadota bacterium]